MKIKKEKSNALAIATRDLEYASFREGDIMGVMDIRTGLISAPEEVSAKLGKLASYPYYIEVDPDEAKEILKKCKANSNFYTRNNVFACYSYEEDTIMFNEREIDIHIKQQKKDIENNPGTHYDLSFKVFQGFFTELAAVEHCDDVDDIFDVYFCEESEMWQIKNYEPKVEEHFYYECYLVVNSFTIKHRGILKCLEEFLYELSNQEANEKLKFYSLDDDHDSYYEYLKTKKITKEQFDIIDEVMYGGVENRKYLTEKYGGNAMYKHDCNRCIFLGIYKGNDLYYHPAGDNNHENFVARYGNNGHQYSSGVTMLTDLVDEARKRVTEFKLK